MVPISKDLGQEMCTALLGVYVFTGEDCNAAFKGKGKKKAIKLLKAKPEFLRAFAKLGDSWKVDKAVFAELEKFVCALYALPRFSKVNEARHFKLMKMCGNKKKLTRKSRLDLYKLPPCKNSLLPDVKRKNFQLNRLKQSHVPIPDIPSPSPDHGWIITEGGLLEPQWSAGDILPQSVIDVMQNESATSDTDTDSDNDEPVTAGDEGESGPDSDWSDTDSDTD